MRKTRFILEKSVREFHEGLCGGDFTAKGAKQDGENTSKFQQLPGFAGPRLPHRFLCKQSSWQFHEGLAEMLNARRVWCVLGLQYFFLILEWASKYSLNLFKSDLIYARLADLPPLMGLYLSFVPPLIYAILGTSKGMSRSKTVTRYIFSYYITLKDDLSSFCLAWSLIGIQFVPGKLGFVIDMLSLATIVGFMAGAATVVSLQQLKGILGLEHFTPKTDIVSVTRSISKQVDQWKWETILLGITFLVFLLVTQHISKKGPRLCWISGVAHLTSIMECKLLAT